MPPPHSIGRYRVEGELGRGGMGVVYRAVDPELDRPVAIKLIRLPPDASDELRAELEKRFRREAKAAARIRHHGVVAIHDVGSTSEGLYLVMELVEGGSLADRLAQGELLDATAAIDLASRAAEALGAAHRAGVVHRDVKPANVMLSTDGRVLLTDFGVARSLDEVSELTRTGMVVGSPAYMAPEQLQGAAVDGRADLFSLGVVLYELLLRKRPFPAQSITTLLYQILHEDPLADPDTLRELEPATAAVLRNLLAKRPEERYADAGAVVAALRALGGPGGQGATVPAPLPAWSAPAAASTWGSTPATAAQGEPSATSTHLPGPGTPSPWPPPPARHRPSLVLLWAGTALAALVVAVGVVAWWRANPERPRVEGTRLASAGWDPAAAGPLVEPVGPAAAVPTPAPALTLPLATPLPLPPPPTPPATPSRPAPPAATPLPEPEPPPQPPPREEEESRPPPPPQETPDLVVSCRLELEFDDVEPEEAQVWLDGRLVGTVEDLESLRFYEPGRYMVRFTHEGYHSRLVEVNVAPDARRKAYELELELPEIE